MNTMDTSGKIFTRRIFMDSKWSYNPIIYFIQLEGIRSDI